MASPRDFARVYKSNAILTASPGQLVLMMFDGALKSLSVAKAAFERPKTDLKRIEVINRELLKAQAIIAELKGSLNHEVEGDFSATMTRLYDYYYRRLLEANLRKQVEPIVEVERLLSEIRDAWAEMLKKRETASMELPVAVA